MRSVVAALLALASMAVALSVSADAASGLKEAVVELGGKRFTVEVADDDATRMRGLMYRRQLAADRGMLFLFEREQPLAFWMKNTYIPLDILYFDSDWRLVSVARGAAPCVGLAHCPVYPSAAPARYVLELNAGLADTLGVQVGTRLEVSLEATSD